MSKTTTKIFKPGSAVYHTRLKQKGTFIAYDTRSDEDAVIDFIDPVWGSKESKVVSLKWLVPVMD